ncbi:unnamed protein product [Toxocara canis]|uniref:Carboxylic ester hydrolase n=1 Tax=Toxocara canis TaxID=6265 RepID=A0A183V989_TOXCA|nr:unnamed protein product [Toxocara canis]
MVFQKSECAVVVYIHGGSFYFQSATMFNENSIAKKYSSHHIIFVIIAYRLGIFGFISIGDGKAAAKNLAFHDMIAALQWVHDEISNFGGNPNRVTLMGHSGGATAVQLLSLCPRVPYRFFQQGISLSSADLYRKNLSNSMTMEIAYRVKCAERSVAYESEAVVECLRQKTASELLRHQKSLTDADYFDLMFGPEPDEELFPADIPVLLPRQNRRRMLLGITKHELALTRFSSTAPQECKTFTTVFGYHTKQTRRACTDNYSFRKGKLLVMRDETRASVFRMAAKLALNNTPVYLYSFDMPGHDMHSGDLLFAMGTHPRKEMTDNEIAMNQIYPSYIRKFVTDGQPDSGISWLPFDERRNNFMRITYETLANGSTINPHMTVGFYPNQIKLWLDHFGEVERAALEAQAKRAVLELQTIETNNDLGEDLGGINDLRWMSIFWISVAFGCMLIAAVILLGILLLINNGVPSFLRYKFKRHFAGERFVLENSDLFLIFFLRRCDAFILESFKLVFSNS